MTNAIKKYKPIVAVQVAFGHDNEILYYEGSLTDFESLYGKVDAIRFERHSNRVVMKTKIKDWWEVKDQSSISIEEKLSGLDSAQRGRVKALMDRSKKAVGEDPSPGKVDNMIRAVLKGKQQQKEENISLSKLQRFFTSSIIRKQKVAQIVTGKLWGFNGLSDEG